MRGLPPAHSERWLPAQTHTGLSLVSLVSLGAPALGPAAQWTFEWKRRRPAGSATDPSFLAEVTDMNMWGASGCRTMIKPTEPQKNQ